MREQVRPVLGGDRQCQVGDAPDGEVVRRGSRTAWVLDGLDHSRVCAGCDLEPDAVSWSEGVGGGVQDDDGGLRSRRGLLETETDEAFGDVAGDTLLVDVAEAGEEQGVGGDCHRDGETTRRVEPMFFAAATGTRTAVTVQDQMLLVTAAVVVQAER